MFNGFKKIAAEQFLKSQLADFLENEDLQLEEFDTDAKKIRVSAMLVGEDKKICVEIDDYAVVGLDGDNPRVVVKSAKSDRQWVDSALKKFLVGRGIPVSSFAAGFL